MRTHSVYKNKKYKLVSPKNRQRELVYHSKFMDSITEPRRNRKRDPVYRRRNDLLTKKWNRIKEPIFRKINDERVAKRKSKRRNSFSNKLKDYGKKTFS